MINESIFRFLSKAQFLVLIVIYFWMGIANVAGTPAENINDLVMHAAGYFIAMFSGFCAFHSIKRFWYLLIGLWLFSLMIELIQYYLPWRSFSVSDLIANLGGLLGGYVLILLFKVHLLKIIEKISPQSTKA